MKLIEPLDSNPPLDLVERADLLLPHFLGDFVRSDSLAFEVVIDQFSFLDDDDGLPLEQFARAT